MRTSCGLSLTVLQLAVGLLTLLSVGVQGIIPPQIVLQKRITSQADAVGLEQIQAQEQQVGNGTFYNGAMHPGADPFTLWDERSGSYYAYSTSGAEGSGYLFAIYKSPDLSTWTKMDGGAMKQCSGRGTPRESGQACWAQDWHWAPEVYHNNQTGWYFFFFAGRLQKDLTKHYFRYSKFEEGSKIGVAVSREPHGPFEEIQHRPIQYFPFDPDYYDVNLIMDEEQLLPPKTQQEGRQAPKGTFIPMIDANVFFDENGKIYLYGSRNAYRNWVWDDQLNKYIEESNVIGVQLTTDWWEDPNAKTMPEIISSEKDKTAPDAPDLPRNITSYNGTGEIGSPRRKDGFYTVISYHADPQSWENAHVDDYQKSNGTNKDRRWSEGSTLISRKLRASNSSNTTYLITYSANNFQSPDYGVGFAYSRDSPLGPFRKSAKNPILSSKPNSDPPIYSVGHGSIIATPSPNTLWLGAQDVTHETPSGSELFYVHHGRNSTMSDRFLYTTRMKIDESSTAEQGLDSTMSMSLTSQDQPLPLEVQPITFGQLSCAFSETRTSLLISVTSHRNGTFDIREGTNRVVVVDADGRPLLGEPQPVNGKHGLFMLSYIKLKPGSDSVRYDRLNRAGEWKTVVTAEVPNTCASSTGTNAMQTQSGTSTRSREGQQWLVSAAEAAEAARAATGRA
ncbi:GLYCOSYL HYDROLASE 43 FAMILY MEMBER [Ceraceosorus bombacis]|uniref:GLYCOSYL HYDROLASE 43 FAMILY MEMBER n=1 Tax=Ceraceosorus bombacis TaxID=401625 RepID=A0A0P1BCT8_9BASI|nr:GLYCOSYL HYDROLASE 43 FAMILY MEMBER [Ceraceosorus bombacis]